MACFFSLSASAALVVACGASGSSSGSPASTLDCNWLAGPNCYQSTVSAASGCLPDSNASGTMSADGKTCTYASGQVVRFDSPVTLPLPSQQYLSFTVTTGGTQCLEFTQSTSDNFTVTTSGGTFVWATQGDAESATCPNGSSFTTAGTKGDLALISCDGGQGAPPGTAVVDGATTLQFLLFGLGSPSGLPIFACDTM